MRRWGAGAGSLGCHGGRGVGRNDEGDEGIPFPSSPWAAVERGVLATGAGGRQQWSLWRRRWGAGVEGWRWQASCEARGQRAGPIYRRGEAVEREGRRLPSSTAINGGLASSRCRGAAARFAALYRTTRWLGQGRAAWGHRDTCAAHSGSVLRVVTVCCAWWCCASRESWDDKEASLADLHAEWSSTHAVAMANNLLVVVSCLCASTQRGDEERARD